MRCEVCLFSFFQNPYYDSDKTSLISVSLEQRRAGFRSCTLTREHTVLPSQFWITSTLPRTRLIAARGLRLRPEPTIMVWLFRFLGLNKLTMTALWVACGRHANPEVFGDLSPQTACFDSGFSSRSTCHWSMDFCTSSLFPIRSLSSKIEAGRMKARLDFRSWAFSLEFCADVAYLSLSPRPVSLVNWRGTGELCPRMMNANPKFCCNDSSNFVCWNSRRGCVMFLIEDTNYPFKLPGPV